jgi:hypothetical protein
MLGANVLTRTREDAVKSQYKVAAAMVGVVSALLGGSARARAGYGSIYYDFSSGGHGEASGFSSPERAKANAQSACRKYGNSHCKIAIPTFDSCGALSVGANGEPYWGIGQYKDWAVKRSMSACMKDGGGCAPLVAVCNPTETSTTGPGNNNSHPNQDEVERRHRDDRQQCLDFPHQGRCP